MSKESPSEYKQQITLRDIQTDQLARLTRMEPTMFNIGDIVRASISFIVFPYKEKNAVLMLILKALTHIESIRTNVST